MCDFGSKINKNINLEVISLFNNLRDMSFKNRSLGLTNCVPSYNKLLINYDNSIIGDGDAFKDAYDKPLISWIPSIAPSNIQFYNKNMFKDWRGDLLVTSLKFRMLIRLEIENNKVIDEEIILRGCKIFNEPCQNIGRIRDIEIDKSGVIYIITDEPNSSIWKIYK